MLMYSFRLGGRMRRSVTLLFMLLAVMAAGRLMLRLIPDAAMTSGQAAKRASGKTEEQRRKFIESLGWQAAEFPVETIDVVIPKEFDDIYQSYNELQKSQGMDLSRYRGKRCKKYSYSVLNHPSGEQNVRLNLLVCGGRIIGGDVCSMSLDGFMQGLARPVEEATAKAG